MQYNENPKVGRFFSVQWSMLIAFTITSGAILIVAYFGLYNLLTGIFLQQTRISLTAVLHGAIEGVDGDKFESLVADSLNGTIPDLEADRRYSQHQKWLMSIRQLNPSISACSYVKGEKPGEILWVGDVIRFSKPPYSKGYLESYSNPGLSSDYERGLQEVVSISEPFTDEWGTWTTVIGPIKNSRGEIIGALALNQDATILYKIQDQVRNRLLIGFGIAYNILFLLFFFVSQFVNRQYTQLTEASEYIAERDYELSLIHI